MAWDDDAFVVAFDAEAGDTVSALATEAQKIQWFNEGMSRLLQHYPRETDVTWEEGDRDVDLPSDFIQVDKVVLDEGAVQEPWRVWGQKFVIDTSEGANADGGARIYYWAEWPVMSDGMAGVTELTPSQDYACLYFALHRFYKRLSSNRMYYKRYATLVGQNAVSTTDLQQESDRYYQDFLDARDDLRPEPSARFYTLE